MLKTLLSLLILAVTSVVLPAQSWDPVYFPSELMMDKGVEMVTEYETQISDPLDQAGSGNRIRLARKMNYELLFDRNGQKVKQQNFKAENKPHDHLDYEFDDGGRLTEMSYTYPQEASVLPGAADSATVILHRRHTLHYYLENGKQDYREVKTENGDGLHLIEKVQFNYDALGRLADQTVYVWRDSLPDSLQKVYTHFARGINISTRSGKTTLHRELMEFDGKSRLVSRNYFNADNPAPRYRETYSYSPRGWLERIEYTYNWEFYQQSESVISRENIYDDHGKLSEAILDYGDGHRAVKYYDYSYFAPLK
jgi:hypothetical protein